MRPFASVVWIMVFALSTFISGVLPVHSPFEVGHALAERMTADPSMAMQPGANSDLARQMIVPTRPPSVYPALPDGYPALAPCQITETQITNPTGWPAAAPHAPFSQTFDAFLAQNMVPPIAPGSTPYPISITQSVTSPQKITPRTGFNMPYQLLYSNSDGTPMYPGPTIRVVSQQNDGSTLQVGADTMPTPPPMTQLQISNKVIPTPTPSPGSGPTPTPTPASGGTPTPTPVSIPFPYFTTHLHGGHTPPGHDGHPDDLNPPMPTMQDGISPAPWTIPPHTYSYTNDQQAQILWYHDHADMNTSPHVSAGLYAFYIIQENQGDGDNFTYLPKPPYDIPLGFQAMSAGGATFVAVDGLDSPTLNVEGRFYRFRLLNASAGQSISVELCGAPDESTGLSADLNGRVWIIGTDGGLMETPVNLATRALGMFQDGRLDVFQAERYDLLIDFTGLEDQQLYLSAMVRGPNGCLSTNTATTPYTCTNAEEPILQFTVGKPTSEDTMKVEYLIPGAPGPKIGNTSWEGDVGHLANNHPHGGPFSPKPDRVFTFDRNTEGTISGAPGQFVISDQPYDMFRLTYSGGPDKDGNILPYPQIIKPALIQANSVELWEFQNTVPCAIHPVHVHDIEFQVVGIDGQQISSGQSANFFGWKDIFVLPPLTNSMMCPWIPAALNNGHPSISFMGYYESHWVASPSLAAIGDTVPWLTTSSGTIYTALTSGTYVFHCHNLGHEDNAMMGQFQVAPPQMPAGLMQGSGNVEVALPAGPGAGARRGMPPGPGMAPMGVGPPGSGMGSGMGQGMAPTAAGPP